MTFETSVHNVRLTGNEISTILYCLEGYIQGNDEYDKVSDFSLDVDNIFSALEEVADNYQGEFKTGDTMPWRIA
tara:strand:- start:86 stop:307 length:222 start_codon:yes stop_codon:yes gene_type:complete